MLFQIEQFHQDSDGNDWLPTIQRAQATWNTTPAQKNDRGLTLLFEPKEYTFSGSIELIRGMSLVGSGGAGWFAGTILKFPPDVYGIICHRDTTAPTATPGRGDWSIVERLRLQAQPGSASVAHGVLMHARMTLRDSYITGFSGDGIHIQASSNATPSTNANNWQVQNCRVDFCNNGLYLQGADTNAGCAIALDCSDNQGWGIYDDSFLGNTYVACHTANNKQGAYHCTGKNTRSCFLNCYSEGGQTQSEINAPSVVVGGFMTVTGNAIWLNANGFFATFANGVRGFSHQETGKPIVAGYLGSSMSGVALELHHVNPEIGFDAVPYRLHYSYQQAGWWELIYANLNGAAPLRFSTGEAAEGQGQLWMENGCHIGTKANRVKVTSGNAPPTTGTWNKGDRILNHNPTAGGYAGWICVEASSERQAAGVWKGFGLIEA